MPFLQFLSRPAALLPSLTYSFLTLPSSRPPRSFFSAYYPSFLPPSFSQLISASPSIHCLSLPGCFSFSSAFPKNIISFLFCLELPILGSVNRYKHFPSLSNMMFESFSLSYDSTLFPPSFLKSDAFRLLPLLKLGSCRHDPSRVPRSSFLPSSM